MYIPYLQQPVFRYKVCEGIQPNPLSTFGVPRDILDLATGTDASKLVDLLKLVSVHSKQPFYQDLGFKGIQ